MGKRNNRKIEKLKAKSQNKIDASAHNHQISIKRDTGLLKNTTNASDKDYLRRRLNDSKEVVYKSKIATKKLSEIDVSDVSYKKAKQRCRDIVNSIYN